MSETEDTAVTLLRLLKTQMHVVLDSGALASVNVSGEWQNSDAFKAFDGQVTVGLVESADQKIDLSGKIRRRTSTVRVNVWVTDKSTASEGGKTLRSKLIEEVNRIIRQNRCKPSETIYTYVNLGSNESGCRVFYGDSEAAPHAQWTELSDIDYSKLWYSDDSRCQISVVENGEKAVLLFGFKLESRNKTVKQAVFSFEGFASAPDANGVTVKVWNCNAGAWQNPQSNTSAEVDETLALTLTANLPNFIDGDGYVWFLAETSGTSDGATPAILHCDHASCTVTVNGVTYCDIAGYRNLDRVDIKPAVYRTEFTIKSWYLENIGV